MADDDDYQAPPHKALLAAAPSFFIPPPFAELIAFGMYVKRARYFVNMTQTRLEQLSGVDQGQISRLERALAPWSRIEDLVLIGQALGRALPLGYCPHGYSAEQRHRVDPNEE